MKPYILAIFSLSLFIFAAEPVGFVKNTEGECTIDRLDKAHIAEKGEYLYGKDKIITSKNSTIAISFNDGTRISVGSSSTVNIDDYIFEPARNNYKINLFLPKGKMVFESGKVSKLAPKSVSIKTLQGVIGIRGTKFAVEAK
jgi:hypothetical protein